MLGQVSTCLDLLPLFYLWKACEAANDVLQYPLVGSG